MFNSITARGTEYLWTAHGDHRGTLEVLYGGCSNIPQATFVFVAGSLELIFDVTNTSGVILIEESKTPPFHRAKLDVRW